MKAIQMTKHVEIEVLRLVELPDPEHGPGAGAITGKVVLKP